MTREDSVAKTEGAQESLFRGARYTFMPNSFPMNFTWAITLPFATLLPLSLS
jgi:hypothetical protein